MKTPFTVEERALVRRILAERRRTLRARCEAEEPVRAPLSRDEEDLVVSAVAKARDAIMPAYDDGDGRRGDSWHRVEGALSMRIRQL